MNAENSYQFYKNTIMIATLQLPSMDNWIDRDEWRVNRNIQQVFVSENELITASDIYFVIINFCIFTVQLLVSWTYKIHLAKIKEINKKLSLIEVVY